MAIDQKLLRWYKKNGRDLPWRKTREPYKILISEVMLQQTQVPRVLLYYKKWLKQFPNWKALANASNAEVIRAWAGLGYNRRALALRDIAKQVAERGAPKSVDEWQQLKGIGPYTAAAVSVFTKTERVMPIDTNIRRVLDRVLLGVPFPNPQLDEKLNVRTPKLLNRVDFDLVPQALFDLATSICKKIPDCAICPLRDECLAAPKFLKGSVRIPKAMIKKPVENIHRNKKYPDRIYRGRILKLVREAGGGAVVDLIGPAIDPTFNKRLDNTWLHAMITRLINDHMLKRGGQKLFLK